MDLPSRRSTSPVLSARQRFTFWFGMEQGGSAVLNTHPLLPPLPLRAGCCSPVHSANKKLYILAVRTRSCWKPLFPTILTAEYSLPLHVRAKKPSTLRCRRLYPSRGLQLDSLSPVFFWESYLPIAVRALILRPTSHLDAFSGSWFRT
jgi:hypothetical protein